MATRDLVISFLSSVRPGVLEVFREKPLMFILGISAGQKPGYAEALSQYAQGNKIIPGLFRAAGGKPGDTIGRVCLVGFSAGCQGIGAVMRYADGLNVDTVLAIDGVHGSYGACPTGTTGKCVNLSGYKGLLNFAAHCAQQSEDDDPDAPHCVVTHSSIVPPNFPSTTESAATIWTMVSPKAPEWYADLECGFNCSPLIHAESLSRVVYQPPRSFTSTQSGGGRTVSGTAVWNGFADGWYDRSVINNFACWGWGDQRNGQMAVRDKKTGGGADHIFQGNVVLDELLKEYVARRWNLLCPPAVSGFGTDDPIGCKVRQGKTYEEAGDKTDYFPELGTGGGQPGVPPPSKTCPAPKPGWYLASGPGESCKYLPDTSAVTTVPLDTPTGPGVEASGDVTKMLLAWGAGFLGGYWGVQGARWYASRRK